MPATPFLPKSFVEPIISTRFLILHQCRRRLSALPSVYLKLTHSLHIVGVTFAVAIPLIIAAFKIQWVMNKYKLFKLWVSEKLKDKEDHYWPDFLDKEKVEQDSEQS
jgi:hypothetical protein